MGSASSSVASAGAAEQQEHAAAAARARQLFAKLDADGSGRLNCEELIAALRQHGIPATRAAVVQLRRRMTKEAEAEQQAAVNAAERHWMRQTSAPTGDNSLNPPSFALDVNEDDFVRFYCERADQMRKAYNQLSETVVQAGGTGAIPTKGISASDLHLAAQALGLTASVAEVDRLLSAIDRNADGMISYEEFEEFMLLLPAVNVQAVFDIFDNTVVVESPHPEWSPHMNFFSRRGVHRPHMSAEEMRHAEYQLFAGAVAGIMSRTCTAPIDRVRLILQSASSRAPSTTTTVTPAAGNTGLSVQPAAATAASAASAASPANSRAGPQLSAASASGRTSALSVIRSVIATEGIKGLWRGNAANVVKIAPESAVRFASFEYLKPHLARDPDNITARERFVAGGIAGVISQTLIYPLEIARTCMSVSAAGTYSSIWHCTTSIMKTGGLRALYAGWSVSTLGIVPYAGLDLAMNSMMRERVTAIYEKQHAEPGILTLLSCGMVSATFAMLCTYPIGLVRTRLQASSVPGAPRFDGIVDCARKTYQEGGIRAFYRGVGPTTIKVVPSAAISYACYSRLTTQFKKRESAELAAER